MFSSPGGAWCSGSPCASSAYQSTDHLYTIVTTRYPNSASRNRSCGTSSAQINRRRWKWMWFGTFSSSANVMCTTPSTIDSFILNEFVNTSALSAPCQLGSRPNAYVCPVGSAVSVPVPRGHVQPERKRCMLRLNTSLYTRPVNIENRPMPRIM